MNWVWSIFQDTLGAWNITTGSAVMLHSVQAHRQSQCRSPNFNPSVKFTPLKFYKSNSAHVTISRTSTPVPNFIAIPLRGAFPQICEILRFCYFIIVLSCPGYTFFSLATPPRSNTGRILTIYGLNNALSPKDVPFGGLDDDPQY